MAFLFSKELPVRKDVDVLVVGGGPAGIGATIAASRNEAKVCLIEQRGFLGGNMTGCYLEQCNWFLQGQPTRITGIYGELEKKYGQKYGKESNDMRKEIDFHRFHSEYLKVFLDEIMEEEGIEIILHCFGTDSVVEDGKIKGVVVDSKSGLEVVLADTIIDTTGDGDIAAKAGVSFEIGRKEDGFCQPGTLSFRLAGVNTKKVAKLIEQHGAGKGASPPFFSNILRKAQQEGTSGLSCSRPGVPFGRITEGGQVCEINFSDVYKINPTKVEDLTYGEIKARKQIVEMVEFMRQNFPGFEQCEVSSFAPFIGFRDSRRIKAEYKLTSNDIDSQVDFTDIIATYPTVYDMLSPSGRWDDNFLIVNPNKFYNIPYRCLVPVSIDNLLVAGRCIYTDHRAEASLRAISACMATGEAAGTAAALCCKENVTPRGLNVRKLQYQLKKQGVRLKK